MSSFLSDARQSVWTALNLYAPLIAGGAYNIKTKYTFDDAGKILEEANPTSGAQLPAVAIFPNEIVPKEFLQQTRHFPYPVVIHFWTRQWKLDDAEQLWQHILDAVFQQKADPADSFGAVKTVCKYHPSVSTVSFQRVNLGRDGEGDKAIYGTFNVILKLQYNPWQG